MLVAYGVLAAQLQFNELPGRLFDVLQSFRCFQSRLFQPIGTDPQHVLAVVEGGAGNAKQLAVHGDLLHQSLAVAVKLRTQEVGNAAVIHLRQIRQQIEQVTRQLAQAQRDRDGRGWWAKMIKPNEALDQIEQWGKQQAGLEQKYAHVSQQRQSVDQDLAQAYQQHKDVDAQYQSAWLELSKMKVRQLSGNLFKHDLGEAMRRHQQSPDAGMSADQQFGMNHGHHHNNDHGMGM